MAKSMALEGLLCPALSKVLTGSRRFCGLVILVVLLVPSLGSAQVCAEAFTRSPRQLLESTKTIEQFESALEQIYQAVPTEYLDSSVLQLDLLAPLRNGQIELSASDKQRLRSFLLQKSEGDNNYVAWKPLRQAFDLLASPDQAPRIIAELINSNHVLADDFDSTGLVSNRSLLASLEKLPEEIRLQLVNSLQRQRRNLRINDTHSKQEKRPRRNMQFIQFLLLYRNLRSLMTSVKADIPVQQKLENVESFLRLMGTGESRYDFNSVISAARTMQRVLRSHFQSRDSIDIFGSFPNLSADKATSDVDISLSHGLDRNYRQTFGGAYDMGSFLEPKSNSISALRLSEAFQTLEQALEQNLGINREPGELISVNGLPVEGGRGGSWQRDGTRSSHLRTLATVSPVMIRITANSIIIKIYDSISEPKKMVQFQL